MYRYIKNYLLAIHWILFLNGIEMSITGVTYLDDFDFEERYRDVNECNPLHWYPLHLPEKCMPAFEKLIRSRIASFAPHRVVVERELPQELVFEREIPVSLPRHDYEEEYEYYQEHPVSPFEALFDLIRRDINRQPIAPSLEITPNFGAVALYRQPISRKSKKLLKKLSKAYADSMRND